MLAVAGGKGGCGKTTTTLGVACALARQGRDVLAVDADRAMPNLHERANVDRDPGLSALEAGATVDGVAQRTPAARRVRIIAAGAPTDEADLRRALGRLPAHVPTVVDCPAGAGPAAAAPLRLADRTLLVSTPNPASLRDAAKTAAMARALDAPPVGVVLTRCETSPAGVKGLLDCEVCATIDTAGDGPWGTRRVERAFDLLVTKTVLGNI